MIKTMQTVSYNVMTLLGRQGLSKTTFCQRHGLSESTLERILDGKNVSVGIIEDYARVFHVEPWQLLKEGGME
ncbi:helix-turn-helix domain-containing protein [Lacticaseibacillus hegangensis]|uniref:Helix-turn-helix domain-containing protein n=1 Tax=Lacticaseibacillus hegangensis TaxID=2486010 RepID=A0ABW4CYQ9_9LACO|nr:helix-turn-helix transcriptional regulator [Lacticaseibacillus hegangensis]